MDLVIITSGSLDEIDFSSGRDCTSFDTLEPTLEVRERKPILVSSLIRSSAREENGGQFHSHQLFYVDLHLDPVLLDSLDPRLYAFATFSTLDCIMAPPFSGADSAGFIRSTHKNIRSKAQGSSPDTSTQQSAGAISFV